jgi:hypothetical protein
MEHEVLDLPRMIVNVERMNIRQENPEEGQETKTRTEPQKESENVLLQMKETLNDHRNIKLTESCKEKNFIQKRIGGFDIDCVVDEETKVTIMTERTWEIFGKHAMIPSLGGIGLFRGKLIALCGKLTQISMSAHGTLTKQYY